MSKKHYSYREKFLLELGDKVRKERLKKGLSQFQLANEAEMPKNQIGRIERGEINTSVYNLKCIADALEVPIINLIN